MASMHKLNKNKVKLHLNSAAHKTVQCKTLNECIHCYVSLKQLAQHITKNEKKHPFTICTACMKGLTYLEQSKTHRTVDAVTPSFANYTNYLVIMFNLEKTVLDMTEQAMHRAQFALESIKRDF